MALRSYAGAAKRTTLSGDITATSTNILVADATGYPTGVDGPFAVAFALGNAAEEKVLIASRSGNTLTVATGGRGYDDTTAADHRTGTSVDHVLTAIDVREANAFVNGGGVSTSGGSTVTASAASVIPLVVKGAASQTANLLEARDETAAVRAQVNAAGGAKFGAVASGDYGSSFGPGVDGVSAVLRSGAGNAGVIGLVVRGAASQTANLAEFQNSAGTVLAAISAGGRIVTSVGNESTTVAGGGSATALPANPFGYLSITLSNGSHAKIPYYAG